MAGELAEHDRIDWREWLTLEWLETAAVAAHTAAPRSAWWPAGRVFAVVAGSGPSLGAAHRAAAAVERWATPRALAPRAAVRASSIATERKIRPSVSAPTVT